MGQVKLEAMFCLIDRERHLLERLCFMQLCYRLDINRQAAERRLVSFAPREGATWQVGMMRWTKQENAFAGCKDVSQTGPSSSMQEQIATRLVND